MSQDQKHTPGPWTTVTNNHFEVDDGAISCRVVFVKNGRDVAYCPPTDSDNGNANAALIARAPEMQAEIDRLKALLVRWDFAFRTQASCELVNETLAALKKAGVV